MYSCWVLTDVICWVRGHFSLFSVLIIFSFPYPEALSQSSGHQKYSEKSTVFWTWETLCCENELVSYQLLDIFLSFSYQLYIFFYYVLLFIMYHHFIGIPSFKILFSQFFVEFFLIVYNKSSHINLQIVEKRL